MCLADHCSLVVAMDNILMSVIVPLCDEVTWQQPFSWMPSRGVIHSFIYLFCLWFTRVLLSPVSLFISGLSMTPVPLREIRQRLFCLPDVSVYHHRFSWNLFSLTFGILFWGLPGSWFGGFWFQLSLCIVWSCYPFWTDFRDLKNLLDGTENCFWSAAWWISGHKQNGRQPLSGCIPTLYKDEMSEVPAALCREVIWSSCFGDWQHIPTNNSRFLPFIASICSKQLNVHQSHNHLQQKASVPLLSLQKV